MVCRFYLVGFDYVSLMPYIIYNEDNEKMRVVHRLEEAKHIIKTRTDWTYKFFKKPKQVIDLSQFEEAPF
jgi:hypothetical protein